MTARTHDVAIYMPFAAGHYRKTGPEGGGAELQTVILARELTARGLRVAHIVWPVDDPIPRNASMPSLIERGGYQGGRRLIGGSGEVYNIWRGMAAADASAYVFRTGRSQLLVAALFCRAHGRKLVYAGSHDFDFIFDRAHSSRSHRVLYQRALRRTDAIVTQTEEQRELARQVLPDPSVVTMIPSFVEPAAPAAEEPEGFVWIGRLASYKRPLEYVRLAEAMPDVRFTMVVRDRGAHGELRQELELAERRLPNLELVGQRPRQEVLELIGRSFAIVTTSSFEGMPNVLLEAWARGVPVASLEWDPGGRIAERDLGRVAEGSRERLVEIARSLSRDAELRAELGRNARQFVREVHDPDVVGARWRDLLGEVLTDRLEPGVLAAGP